MKVVPLVLLIVVCCPHASGQKFTAADPYGLATFGFGEKREKRTLIKPDEGPTGARECGAGVYVMEETATVNDKPKKVKAVVVYFEPNPATLSAFGELHKGVEPQPAVPSLLSLGKVPVGAASLTFFWPARS